MGTLTQELKNALAEASPEIGEEFHVMQTNIRDSLLRERLMAALSGFFGALATLLAMMGLFGVMSNSVARRTGEIGLRIALGAQRRNILGMVLCEAGTMLVLPGHRRLLAEAYLDRVSVGRVSSAKKTEKRQVNHELDKAIALAPPPIG